jgi:excisionase family DNA binding protein
VNTDAPASEWLTLKQAAGVAQVGLKLAYREVRCGRLRAARVGSKRGPIRVHRSWVTAWLEASATPVELATTRGHQEPKPNHAGVNSSVK